MARLTRRQFIGVTSGGAQVPVGGPAINPRSSWAVDRPPRGPLDDEDVRFLIVHHSASQNGHTGADTPAILRTFYDHHTGPERGWNDIAYNFLIDSDGGIWEGRAGSLDGPVAGDATGGNQGFTQLVCIIGNYDRAQPEQASKTSLVSLLAWLADRYDVSTIAGAETSFTSRGSNRHPAGTMVTTPTITGHRTMSRTRCPGDNLNAYVTGGLMGDVAAARAVMAPTTTTTRPPTTTMPETTTTNPATPTTTAALASGTIPGEPGAPVGVIATGATLLVAGVGLVAWRHRRMSGEAK